MLSSKRKSSQAFSDREDFSSEHQQVLENNEPLCRFSNPEKKMKSFLDTRTQAHQSASRVRPLDPRGSAG